MRERAKVQKMPPVNRTCGKSGESRLHRPMIMLERLMVNLSCAKLNLENVEEGWT